MRVLLLGIMASLLAVVGCSDDTPGTTADAGSDRTVVPDTATDSPGGTSSSLTYSFTNLEPLGDDFVYEGWIIVADAPVSTGRFSVDSAGATDPATFDVPQEMVDMATIFVLTIEPAVGDVPAPADTHVLAGPLASGTAALTTDHMAAIGTDFSTAAGTFIVATPSSADMNDETNGIWWLTPGMPPTASLTLPTLPAGWLYEGWVVDANGPVSTGTFGGAEGADSDMAGPTAGNDGMMPPFPGQDFVDPARDLTAGHMAVISVEPDPDNGAAPFIIKPLGAMIGTDLAPMTQAMNNIAADNLPSGSATFAAN